jgi:hypothetical protein
MGMEVLIVSDKENETRDTKKPSLIILKNIIDENNKKYQLNEEEQQFKNKLVNIEAKLESIDKVTASIKQENDETIFANDAFKMLVESIAITAAMAAVAEYFDVDAQDMENLLK